jgi:type IV pilus assembly protein PilM
MGRVIAGLSGHNSVYRIISMPELPDAVLPEAVKREAGRVIPVPLDEVYLAYQPLPTLTGETRIFLTAYPRNIADSLHRTLQQAGLQPYLMDLAPLALCRTVNVPRCIIVNARLEHLDIVVMADRIPQLIRRLALPGEEASLPERLPTIAEEIDRTIAFYNSSHQEQSIDEKVPMFVCGDLVEVPDSWPSLAGKTGCPVSILPSPVESPPGFKANDFIINIGLAFKELLTGKEGDNFSLVNLNALPETHLPKPVRLPNIVVPICATIGIGILIFMGIQVYNRASHTDALSASLDPINNSIEQENTEIASLKEQVQLLEPGLTSLGAITAIFDDTFTSLGAVREQVNGDLIQMSSVLPNAVNLTDVNHDGDNLIVVGIAPDEDDIFKYARDLRTSGRFSAVIISSIEAIEEEEEITGFEFEFLLK